jgi:hypothetical protein
MCCAFTYLSSLNASTLSHIYRAPKRELIIMIPSNAHEHTIQAVAEPVRSAMSAQRAQNPELGEYWTMHHNKAATYEEALDGSVEFQPDIGIYHNNDCQLPIEITFTQRWDDIVKKVMRVVGGEECWGVLVLVVREKDKWSPPTRRFKKNDFITKAEWLAQAKASRVENPYGPVCVNGVDWTKGVDVEVCFFNHGWEADDGLPTMVCY